MTCAQAALIQNVGEILVFFSEILDMFAMSLVFFLKSLPPFLSLALLCLNVLQLAFCSR